MAAPTFVAVGALAFTNTITTFTTVAPASSVGDRLIAVVLNKAAANAITSDGSWTQVAQGDTTGTGAHRYSVWERDAAASGASFVWTKTTDDNVLFCGLILAYTSAERDATAVGVLSNASADNVSFPAFDPTSTENRTIYVAIYGNDLTTFAAAMSGDTNPDCTIDCDIETNQESDATIAVTSGTNDGTAIAARTWASNSTTDAVSTGIVFAIVTPAAGGGRVFVLAGEGGGLVGPAHGLAA